MLAGNGTFSAVASQDQIGWQCALDFHRCRSPHLDNLAWVRNTMLEAAARADATVISEQFHHFPPWGIFGVLVVGESHMAVHIWPEHNFAALDIFNCSTKLKLKAATDFLIAAFGAREPRIVTLSRGGRNIVPREREPTVTSAGPLDDLYIDSDDTRGGHWFIREGTVACRKTMYQSAEILDFAHYGRALVLDNTLQSAESDEYIYHEALVQPALCLHPKPARVLIIGGGEGATAREVLKHSTVRDVVMVDLDRELVELAREHLPSWHRESFDDARLRLVFADGHEFVAQTDEQFDVIIVDLVDATEGGPAESLYTAGFYSRLKSRLSDAGILALQAMQCDAGSCQDHRQVRRELEHLFRYARSYLAFVPSFFSSWGFVLASDVIDGCAAAMSEIDAQIGARRLDSQMRFYDGRTHRGMFALTKELRRVLDEP